jgi:hypothetical protein
MRSEPKSLMDFGERSREGYPEHRAIRGRPWRVRIATTLTDRVTTGSPNSERHSVSMSRHRHNANRPHREPKLRAPQRLDEPSSPQRPTPPPRAQTQSATTPRRDAFAQTHRTTTESPNSERHSASMSPNRPTASHLHREPKPRAPQRLAEPASLPLPLVRPAALHRGRPQVLLGRVRVELPLDWRVIIEERHHVRGPHLVPQQQKVHIMGRMAAHPAGEHVHEGPASCAASPPRDPAAAPSPRPPR